MATTTSFPAEVIALSDRSSLSRDAEGSITTEPNETLSTSVDAPTSATEAIPDGGYGWLVVFASFIHTFWMNGWTGSWGILQVALLQTTLKNSTSGTVSFIGSLGISLTLALGIASVRLARSIGARWATLIGILLFGVGNVLSGFAVHSVGGLFVACGVSYGLGSSLMYTMSNTLPVQWFSSKLGTANGIVKLGGGIGATVMAIVTGALIDRVGIAWTFRAMGLMSLVTGVPAAFLIKERGPAHVHSAIDWSLFKDLSFSCLFAAGAIGVFAIYAPSFFLPYVATSLGLSSSTVAGVMACFNACMAVGRLGSGVACDRFGSMNMLLLTMALNAVTMFAIWSFASTLAVLVVFAVLNGIANGAFFVTMPTAIGRMRLIGDGRAAGGLSMALTGWSPGLLLGNPIAGFLIDATNAEKASSIVPYRPAIFYAGGTALLSTVFVLVARIKMDKSFAKKL